MIRNAYKNMKRHHLGDICIYWGWGNTKTDFKDVEYEVVNWKN
jgi:hypothetical protein